MKLKTIQAELKGRDYICATIRDDGRVDSLQVIGCKDFLNLVKKLKKVSVDPGQWPIPEGSGHCELLIKEFILKLRGDFTLPFQDSEICHCRVVPTDVVDQAIVAGAHTPDKVSRATTASTSCGTCRTDVQSLIDYRLKPSP